MDICQSVLANFFVRAAAGQFDLDQPDQLLRLLAAMARHKVMNHARHERAARRDHRRLEPGTPAQERPTAPGPSPSSVVANQELLQAVRDRLPEGERQLADQRARSLVGRDRRRSSGVNPIPCASGFTRAIDRVAAALHMDD